MIIISVVIICFYFITSIVLIGMGLTVVMPWVFLLFISILFMPLAFSFSIGGISLQKKVSQYPWLLRLSGILAGIFLIAIYRLDSFILLIMWSSSVAFLIVHHIKTRFATVNTFFTAFICIGIGFCCISNLNYVALLQVIDRLQDASLYRLDLAIYSLLFGENINYSGIFPLAKSEILFNFFQSAYFMAFFGVFFVFFTIANIKDSISHFLFSLLGCYVIGLVIFLFFPTVGPFICYPESLRVEYQNTLTYKAMQTMANGFYAVKLKPTSLSDLGYFVSFPSLHVAVAIVLQYSIRNSALHFWMFLPISLALIMSTVYLGFHYFIDIPSGALLAFANIYAVRKLMSVGRRRWSPKIGQCAKL
jgi:membrane-associated phospholipid phosphatase